MHSSKGGQQDGGVATHNSLSKSKLDEIEDLGSLGGVDSWRANAQQPTTTDAYRPRPARIITLRYCCIWVRQGEDVACFRVADVLTAAGKNATKVKAAHVDGDLVLDKIQACLEFDQRKHKLAYMNSMSNLEKVDDLDELGSHLLRLKKSAPTCALLFSVEEIGRSRGLVPAKRKGNGGEGGGSEETRSPGKSRRQGSEQSGDDTAMQDV